MAIQDLTLGQVIADLAWVFEGSKQVPVLEDSITFDTGGVTKEEIKTTAKLIVTSTIDKDDSDISYDIVVDKTLTSSEQTITDSLSATTEVLDITFITRDDKASIKLPGASVTRSYQISDDGVLVKHCVVTPSSAGMTLTFATETGSIAAPTA